MSEPNLGSAGAFIVGKLPTMNGRLGNAGLWRFQARDETVSQARPGPLPSVPAQNLANGKAASPDYAAKKSQQLSKKLQQIRSILH